jgi:hypothetical protein
VDVPPADREIPAAHLHCPGFIVHEDIPLHQESPSLDPADDAPVFYRTARTFCTVWANDPLLRPRCVHGIAALSAPLPRRPGVLDRPLPADFALVSFDQVSHQTC